MVRVICYDTNKFYNLYEKVIATYGKTNANTELFNKSNFINISIDKIKKNSKNGKNISISLEDDFDELIKESARIMKENNFKINPNQFYYEFHLYDVKSTMEPKFAWHIDDYGAVNCEVCTMIYYLDKDETIQGGNLEFANYKVLIQSDMIVMMDGNVLHKPEPMSGYGTRKSIVIMFERKS
jgi:hypothetical protein